MSLFKVRDLWSTRCGREETFDPGCLLVADLSGEGRHHLVTGSHSGFLRVYDPQVDPAAPGGFKPIDLLIEVQLDQPILQIDVGKFVSGSKINYLAILHPRSLAVYNFIAVPGSTEHGDQCEVRLAYEHQLKRSAYRLVSGGFGGVQGREFLCVLALDGTLMFYEQESLTAVRQLPGFLLPSPFVYVSHTDSFIFLNSDWRLQSYRYQVLGDESSEQVLPTWTFNLGEDIVDMQCVSVTTTEAAIFILTDKNFFCFSETGTIKFSKRLQYVPFCCHVYNRGEHIVMAMIVTDSNNLLLYEDSKLVWGAQLHSTPIAVARASLQKLEGCLTLLTDEGDLQCCYLGTEPSVFVPPPLQASVVANSELEGKLSALQHQIATYTRAEKDSLGAPEEKGDLKSSMKVWETREAEGSCVIEITLTASSVVRNVNVAFQCPQPFTVTPHALFIPSLSEKSETAVEVSCPTPSTSLSWELSVTSLTAYMSGEKRCVSSAETQLPLRLLLELVQPVRGLEYGINLSASQVLSLPSLFPDWSGEAWSESGSTEYLVGFRYRARPEISFTLSLNRPALKYRLEGDSLTALTLPIELLSKKLASKHLRTPQYSIALNELFEAVDENIRIRNEIRRIEEELKAGSGQMRACQRRLLSKMRDKTPSDLSSLATLIEYTHSFVMEAAHKLEEAQNELEQSGHLLSNLIRLTTSLIKLTGSASEEEVDLLYEAMSYTENFSEDQGWAEITHISLSNLLKTTLARSVRDQFGAVDQDKIITDSLPLKKKIATAIDRVVKGQRRTNERAVSPIPEGEDEEGRDKHEISYNELESAELKKIIEQAELNLDHL